VEELFQRRLGVSVKLTSDKNDIDANNSIVICYDKENIEGAIHIKPYGRFLLSDEINPQTIQVKELKWWNKIFFETDGDIPFDIFAASFFLLSRYEEYSSFVPDKHGRFNHTHSLAFNHNFLHLPLVDIWTYQLKWQIENKFSFTNFNLPEFSFQSTIDIDFAYRYRGIGFNRYWLKFFNSLAHFKINDCIEQLRVGFNYKNDPYDTYHWIEKTCRDLKLNLKYFVLLKNNSEFDKNCNPYSDVMRNLITGLKNVGLHPSYFSPDNIDHLAHEQRILESYKRKKCTKSRQHFLRYKLPTTFENLIQADIVEDYSTGYSAINGFRASTCHPFRFYNIEKNRVEPLLLHSVTAMDVSFKNAGKTPTEAYFEAEKLMNEVKKVNGVFTLLWHNSNLSHHEGWKPWREVFLKIHTLASSKQNQEID